MAIAPDSLFSSSTIRWRGLPRWRWASLGDEGGGMPRSSPFFLPPLVGGEDSLLPTSAPPQAWWRRRRQGPSPDELKLYPRVKSRVKRERDSKLLRNRAQAAKGSSLCRFMKSENLKSSTLHTSRGTGKRAPTEKEALVGPLQIKPVVFPECSSDYQDYTPCTNPKRWRKYRNYRLNFMERHCLLMSERKECLVPPQDGYKPPIR